MATYLDNREKSGIVSYPQMKFSPSFWRRLVVAMAGCLLLAGGQLPSARAEVILQYFNTSWLEIAQKMPEVVEAGYSALWLPPPTKGSGGLSVGYDLWDPFDLGSKEQRGSVRTRYGTEAELLHLIETAHRFGVRVYFDNIMNHRAFDIPGFNADTPVDIYPGMLPEDFHLKVTQDGFYRKWDNTRSWSDVWQIQNLGLADLIDIAHEGPENGNFGPSEGSTHPKLKFVRDLERPWQYDHVPDSNEPTGRRYVGFGPGNGITREFVAANPDFYKEDVGAYLIRAVRWFIDRTKADGLRLDAVKHVPSYFFGQQGGAGADSSDAGYLGGAQWQFNMTRGYSDWNNHRDSVFNHNQGRDDAMMFGEHLGAPPGFGEYVAAGMRLVDAPLHREMNNRLGNPGSGLRGLDSAGWSGDPNFNQFTGIPFAQSHDDDYANRRELQHAYYMTRSGIPNVYTDGYYEAATLGESGGAFPRHANNPFLGQFGDVRLPNLLEINEAFARGEQIPRFSNGDLVVYERRDKRENGNMSDADGTVLLFMMNDNYAAGQGESFNTSFPSQAGGPAGTDAYLYNYSSYGGGFYKYASEIRSGAVIVPSGGYFAFSWKNPDPSPLWPGRDPDSPSQNEPITIYQDGVQAGTVRVTRRDGPDGDPNFNPYNLANRGYPVGVTPEPFTYQVQLPRVTDATNLRFVLAADGSTENVQFKLNGGIDINSQMNLGPQTGDRRDNPPGLSTDTFLGYEQARFIGRQHPELFAAQLTNPRNVTGSPGAETFTTTGVLNQATSTTRIINTNTAAFVYHDPTATVDSFPIDQYDASTRRLWAKVNSVGAGYKMFVYYTVDETYYPEGAGGIGLGRTRVAEMNYQAAQSGGSINWWASAAMPSDFVPGVSRYKIGVFKDGEGSGAVATVWPGSLGDVSRKLDMLTLFEVANFNGETVSYRPHNDYGETRVGLPDGWHVLRGRAYLNRSGRASIYNTFTQPFYLDTETPRGEVKFPGTNGESVDGQEYGFVVRTDLTVTEVWYHIADSNSNNDDGVTKVWGGNGNGGEPFTDSNRNGIRDTREPFEDINGNGDFDADIGESWAKATRATANPSVTSEYPAEWRFNYRKIPASGNATVRVRLVEASSTPRAQWTAGLSDAQGHFNTLTRQVQTDGPSIDFYIAWPQTDSTPASADSVGPGYTMKVYFSKSLADGLNESQLIEKFTIRLQSKINESNPLPPGGRPLDSFATQSRDNFRIVWNETSQFHALAFDLPNMYNNDPVWLHGIYVDFVREGEAPLSARRLVKAFPVPPPPLVDIISPQEIGSDGRRLEIVLPELANPTPADRQIRVEVKTDGPAADVQLAVAFDRTPEGFAGSLTKRASTVTDPNPREQSGSLFHDYVWDGAGEGQFRLIATVTKDGQTNSTRRNATVVFRQIVEFDDSSDSDNDGIPDDIESTKQDLPPGGNDENWLNGDVHVWVLSGRTDPRRPVSDGGKLPDGLELGLIGPIPVENKPNATLLTADTDGDGFPNFLPDLDPPIYNTKDNSGYNQRLSRKRQIRGSITDPSKPDTEDDGLFDHSEDLNRNGRVDIGTLGAGGKVASIIKHPNIPTVADEYDRVSASAVNRALLPSNARFLETDPNARDTDVDGIDDGREELQAGTDGRLGVFLLASEGATPTPLAYTDRSSLHFKYNLVPNDDAVILTDNRPVQAIRSRAVDYTALFADYNAQGTGALQPGGWPKVLIIETDPLNADTDGDDLPDGWETQYNIDPLDNGSYNFRTGGSGNPANGASGVLNSDGITNLQHYLAGTDPRSSITPGLPGGTNKITIGPGNAIGTINGVKYFEEFADWTAQDLIVLDEYEGDGSNNQGGDIFPAGDQWDSSRDIVAFYARDGGDTTAGGDGLVYFRVDFDDLKALAEDGQLDIYVAVNHTPGTGERVLPDEVDTVTDMRWRAVVALYNGGSGRVYVDTDPNSNTSNFGDNLLSGRGVVVYDQTSPKGLKGAYFNSELDAVEFSISRQALRESGWSGSDFSQLNFQVYTTKDGTGNSPLGAGDLGGRGDLRDTIYDDRVVEDAFFSQSGREDILKSWFKAGADRPAANNRAELMLVAEENQHIRSASWVQDRINNNAGAGYHRTITAHDVFRTPLTLAITPTLASAIEWAKADPAKNQPWRDGPAFNASITELGNDGLLDLASTTFAGHMPAYTTEAFDDQNIDLASSWLQSIYGRAPSTELIYIAERTLNGATLDRIRNLGFKYTFADQREHIEGWFGRPQALGDNGYRLNRVNGVDLIVATDDLSSFRFNNTDKGAPIQIRRALSRKARSGQQQQVVVLLNSLEDFGNLTRADNYDRNVRWYSNRPWIKLVKPSDITASNWTPESRGTLSNLLPPRSKNFVQYAALGSYDNWYNGLGGLREGLLGKKFDIRPGSPMTTAFGRIGLSGVADSAWQSVSGLSADNPLGRLARGVMGSGLFTMAFHNQQTVDLRKYSNGEYINQPRTLENLADFAAIAQANLRHAATYSRVMQWATGGNNPSQRIVEPADVDLDGEVEYLLANNRVFAVFEALGGRMTGAWMRDPGTGQAWQVVGNHLAYSGFADEREGGSNTTANRTSGFKDWLAVPTSGSSASKADDLYTVTDITNGFRFSHGGVVKEITLPQTDQGRFEARYTLPSSLQRLSVRFGLSPNLEDLLLRGQEGLLADEITDGSRVIVVNSSNSQLVRAWVDASSINGAATDTDAVSSTALPRRNQAHTHQVQAELVGSGPHTVVLGFDQGSDVVNPDSDNDGLPDAWELSFFPGNLTALGGGIADYDSDELTDMQEYILGSNPNDASSGFPPVSVEPTGDTFRVTFPTVAGRVYTVLGRSNLTSGTWDRVASIQNGQSNPVNGDDTTKTVTETGLSGTGARFYRVQVELAP